MGFPDEESIICGTPQAMLRSRPIDRIVSGGQTGADRAGLDWAIGRGIPHGGCCPKGRIAEDGVIPERYQLTELKTKRSPAWTRRNVEESDGTLIFTIGPKLAGGAKLTASLAEESGKPWKHVHAGMAWLEVVLTVKAFMRGISVLNVAGSRASKEPDVGVFVDDVLSRVFADSWFEGGRREVTAPQLPSWADMDVGSAEEVMRRLQDPSTVLGATWLGLTGRRVSLSHRS